MMSHVIFQIKKIKSFFISKKFGSVGTNFIAWGKFDIIHSKNFHIGSNVTINHNAYINATDLIKIGNNVAISSGAKLITTKIDPTTLKTSITHINKPITIGNFVQIGAGAIILPGINIGSYVIIGAGAVVTKDIPSNSIAKGVPAKISNLD